MDEKPSASFKESVVKEHSRQHESPQSKQVDGIRITQGQLEAVAMRCRDELDASFRRAGTAAVAILNDAVLTVCIEHSLSAAEHNLMRRATGREFFQHYIEELAEQMYPTFSRHVEGILPCIVTYARVKVDCENDSINFIFGLRLRPSWSQMAAETSSRTNPTTFNHA